VLFANHPKIDLTKEYFEIPLPLKKKERYTIKDKEAK
jgi:hypothetical protein